MFATIVDRHCQSLPGAHKEMPFGAETHVWKVGEKMFAAYTADSNGVSLRAADGMEAQRLVQRGLAVSAPYLKRGGWVLLSWADTQPDALRAHLTTSYELVRASLPVSQEADLPPIRAMLH